GCDLLQLLERRTRLGRAARDRVQLRQHQADVSVRWIEIPCLAQLRFSLGVTRGAHVGDAEIGVAERLFWRQRDDGLELRFRFRQLPQLQVAESARLRLEELTGAWIALLARGSGQGEADPDQDRPASLHRVASRARHAPNLSSGLVLATSKSDSGL